MTIKFSPELNTVLAFSKEEAERLHNDSVTPIHLVLAILRQKEQNPARDALLKLQPDLSLLKQELEAIAKQKQVLVPPSLSDMGFDMTASRILRVCVLEAKSMKSDTIYIIHVLLAILKLGDSDASLILERMNITYQAISQILKLNDNENENENDEDDEDEEDSMEAAQGDDTGALSVIQIKKKSGNSKTPVLDNFGTDLTQAAADGLLDPVVGRQKEIERVAQILSRRKKNNPILIGQPGVGKSAIVEGLAQRIVQHKVSHLLWNKRVIVLDMASVVAGTKYRGQFEERMRSIILELQKNPDIIVFIDEIHTLVGAGAAAGSMDAANMMKPALSRGEFQCIGATTTDEFRKSIEKDGALDRRFQKVMVEPTTQEETLLILQNLKDRYEEHHTVKYTPEALEACVHLTGRYVTERSFPDKAIDAMDEAGSRIHIQDVPVPDEIAQLETHIAELQRQKTVAVREQHFELAAEYRDQLKNMEHALQEKQKEWESQIMQNRPIVDEMVVADVISMMTGIPVQRIGEEENQKLRNLASNLKNAVIGQDDAIQTIARSIQRSRIGLKDPKKPIGTFMFVGPTGVGKTYLTKCLALEMFGSAENIIRIDMSEYMEKHTVSRMVGAPPGYVGFEEGGQLTEKVRRKPYSIVLLDEIEKAHPDVFNILLQMMDEGRLTDGNGATIDFKNTIIVMTSNCGTKQIRDFGRGVGFQSGADVSQNKQLSRDLVQKALKKQFAPEFLNRLDDIIYFDQLSEESIQKIVEIELKPLLQRVKDLGVTLEVTPEARQMLGKKGYDVQYGARPLKRILQTMLEDPLCDVLMQDEHASELKAIVSEDKIKIVEI
jgi:ATP-dependent Clp protease ATP-binding subunit ClpC